MVTDKPWFIIFIKPLCDMTHMTKPNIEAVARDLNGTVQFAFINANNPLNEKMRV